MATISIPTPLRTYVGDNAIVNVSGGTVDEALQDLVTQFPDLAAHIFKEGELRSFVNVFLGEEDIRYLEGGGTSVDETAKLKIIPSIAGGVA